MKSMTRITSTLFFLPCLAIADSSAIDKVYHPYVQPLERELEWRMISADNEQVYRLGLGKSFSDRLFIEAYLIAEDKKHDDFTIMAYELEAKWQLTEQGEYSADWGIIAELEKKKNDNAWEVAAGIIVEKEWGKWIGTANFWGIYEWGEDQDDELESVLALQARYRYSRFFEPAIEFYSGEKTRGLGPVLLGDINLGTGKKLHWELGAIIGLDSKTPDNTWRLLTEFEF
ncbi:MAG: hypothetical protein ACKE9I_09320 [Methylophagaceae bacterium]